MVPHIEFGTNVRNLWRIKGWGQIEVFYKKEHKGNKSPLVVWNQAKPDIFVGALL